MRLVCGVGPLAMGPGSGSFPNRAKDKECRGERMGIHKQGELELQGRSGGAYYVLTMEYNGRPPIPARKNGGHTGQDGQV